MPTLSRESAKECVTAHESQDYLNLAGWPNIAWICRPDARNKNKRNFLACVHPELDP